MTTETGADLERAVALVLSYTSAMNDLETRRYYRSRADAGYFTSESDEERTGGATAAELEVEYRVIFEKHCTNRPRTYGGFLNAWSRGGRYVGVDEDSVTEAQRITPTRIEIVCSGGPFPQQQYKFAIFKKKDRWLIDNILTRSGDEGWQRWQL